MKTTVISGDDLSYAAEVILRGGLVAVPTETVYGLACNGLNAAAVAKIFDVKGRPSGKPLSILVGDIDAARPLCGELPERAARLAGRFWPGPLTMVLPCLDSVPRLVTAGGNTVGVRCPDHTKTLELLKLAGVPLAAPSANISGMPPPRSADEVLAYFDGKIDCIIDGGVSALGVESTVVDLTAEPVKILRRGALSEEDILTVCTSSYCHPERSEGSCAAL